MIVEMILLGIIQGLTEFLPVSSSGHLVLAEALMGYASKQDLTAELTLHVGTLVAVMWFYRADIRDMLLGLLHGAKRSVEEKAALVYLGWVLLGSVPAAVIGIALKHVVEQHFHDPMWVAIRLMGAGVMLLVTRWFANGTKPIRWGRAILIGFAQASAIFPGGSRSGTTISVAMYSGVNPSVAAKYSFWLSIIAIGGACTLNLKDLAHATWTTESAIAYVLGAIVSGIVGFFSLGMLKRLIANGKFWMFGLYCLPVGAIALVWTLMR